MREGAKSSRDMSSIKSSYGPSPSSRRRSIFLFLICCLFLLCLSYWPNFAVQRHPRTVPTAQLFTALEHLEAPYRHLDDKVVYSRYARVYSRDIRFPNGKTFSYDVWGRDWKNDSFAVVTVIPFDPQTQTFTLIREYNIAHTKFVYAFPQGQFERAKHASFVIGAIREMEEEARLTCDEKDMLQLGSGVPQDKYQRESVYYFLCTKTKPSGNAERDEEEDIDIVPGVTVDQLRAVSMGGRLQSNNVAGAYMGMDKLKRMKLMPMSA